MRYPRLLRKIVDNIIDDLFISYAKVKKIWQLFQGTY